jgi:hypothetical protein
MARKTGRVTKKRKRTTPRDLRSKTAAAVKGGASTYAGFQGSVRVASADVGGDNAQAVKKLSS